MVLFDTGSRGVPRGVHSHPLGTALASTPGGDEMPGRQEILCRVGRASGLALAQWACAPLGRRRFADDARGRGDTASRPDQDESHHGVLSASPRISA